MNIQEYFFHLPWVNVFHMYNVTFCKTFTEDVWYCHDFILTIYSVTSCMDRSIENSKAWFSYGSFKIRHFWEYHSSGGICGWNGRLYALSGCEIDLFLCLDVIEINDFISVKMRNRNCVSVCEWNSCQDVKYTSCGVIGWNERWNGLSGCETNMVHCDVDSCIYLWKGVNVLGICMNSKW